MLSLLIWIEILVREHHRHVIRGLFLKITYAPIFKKIAKIIISNYNISYTINKAGYEDKFFRFKFWKVLKELEWKIFQIRDRIYLNLYR